MYTDILMNGSKRFCVVTSHPTEEGRFAQTGVLFELEDLKEVSEQTQDQIKYICTHKVTGRVTIGKILNPEAWETRDTYLKAEATIHDDSGKDVEPKDEARAGDVYGAVIAAATTKDENALRIIFKKLVDLQHDLEEDVRFTKAATSTLAVRDGPDEDGLWQTIRLWQSFVEQRLMSRQNELQQEFQERLKEFLKEEKGLKDGELPRYVVETIVAVFVYFKATSTVLSMNFYARVGCQSHSKFVMYRVDDRFENLQWMLVYVYVSNSVLLHCLFFCLLVPLVLEI